MDLREYLFFNRMEQKELAVLLECNAKYLCHVINGRYKPGPKMSRRIKEVTGIDVQPSTAIPRKQRERYCHIYIVP